MKRWGILITASYVVIFGVLIVPGLTLLAGDWPWEGASDGVAARVSRGPTESGG